MSRSHVLLDYDSTTNRYSAQEQPYQIAIFQYQLPRGTTGGTVSVGNSEMAYPLNTEGFSNMDSSFNETDPHSITLPKGDYIIEGYCTLYYNYQNRRLIGGKWYIEVLSPSATDISGSCSAPARYQSQNNQTDYQMNEHNPWLGYFSLAERSTIRINFRYNIATNSIQFGNPANRDTSTSDNLPEIYGSLKFIKIS